MSIFTLHYEIFYMSFVYWGSNLGFHTCWATSPIPWEILTKLFKKWSPFWGCSVINSLCTKTSEYTQYFLNRFDSEIYLARAFICGIVDPNSYNLFIYSVFTLSWVCKWILPTGKPWWFLLMSTTCRVTFIDEHI
jgi:hypothetical protein